MSASDEIRERLFSAVQNVSKVMGLVKSSIGGWAANEKESKLRVPIEHRDDDRHEIEYLYFNNLADALGASFAERQPVGVLRAYPNKEIRWEYFYLPSGNPVEAFRALFEHFETPLDYDGEGAIRYMEDGTTQMLKVHSSGAMRWSRVPEGTQSEEYEGENLV